MNRIYDTFEENFDLIGSFVMSFVENEYEYRLDKASDPTVKWDFNLKFIGSNILNISIMSHLEVSDLQLHAL